MRYTKKNKQYTKNRRRTKNLKGGGNENRLTIDVAQIEKLADLRNKNIITDEEYTNTKKQLLKPTNSYSGLGGTLSSLGDSFITKGVKSALNVVTWPSRMMFNTATSLLGYDGKNQNNANMNANNTNMNTNNANNANNANINANINNANNYNNSNNANINNDNANINNANNANINNDNANNANINNANMNSYNANNENKGTEYENKNSDSDRKDKNLANNSMDNIKPGIKTGGNLECYDKVEEICNHCSKSEDLLKIYDNVVNKLQNTRKMHFNDETNKKINTLKPFNLQIGGRVKSIVNKKRYKRKRNN